MLRAICDDPLAGMTWSESNKSHRGDVLIMKRGDQNQGSRRHGIARMLVALVAVIAIFGPTLLVVTDAWAKGPGGGSGGSGGGSAGGGAGSGSSGGGNAGGSG